MKCVTENHTTSEVVTDIKGAPRSKETQGGTGVEGDPLRIKTRDHYGGEGSEGGQGPNIV